MTASGLHRAIRSLAAVYALSCLLIVALVGDIGSIEALPALVLFCGWACLPALIAFGASRFALANRLAGSLALLGIAAVCGFGWWAYYQAFVAESDPQSGLVFIFVPLYQTAFICIVAVVAGLIARRRDS